MFFISVKLKKKREKEINNNNKNSPSYNGTDIRNDLPEEIPSCENLARPIF